MILFRAYLLAGLVAHKVVWEILKRRQGGSAGVQPKPSSWSPLLVKTAKTGVLLGILLQTVTPEIFPITSDPTGLRVVGVSVYTLGLFVAIAGRLQLGRNWADIESPVVLEHQRVVATGLYRYIRHPIYVGDILLLVGLELCLNSWLVLGVIPLVPIVVWRAVREEALLANALAGYEAYRAHTRRFVPFVV